MKITEVETLEFRQVGRPGTWLGETLVANPMSIYAEYKARRSSWQADFGRGLVRIRTDDGLEGFAPAGGAELFIIGRHFRRLLLGEDPFNIERLWDIMFRSSMPYGRKGLALHAISAVDLALWDILGKATGLPVYKLLGGKAREKVPCYGTGNASQWYRDFGFVGNKLAMPYGPADGIAGMHKNEELVARAREIIGPDMDLMLDCYMAWDVEYTIRVAEMLKPYRIQWIEEALPPDDIEGYATLAAEVGSTLIATGEHEYTRWGFQELIDRRAADILQPDIGWVGGITECRKICAMAAGRNLPVIPHGGSNPWAIHLVIAQTNCPLAEFLYTDFTATEIGPRHAPLFRGEALPIGGYIAPPDRPGFGLTLDEDVLKEYVGS